MFGKNKSNTSADDSVVVEATKVVRPKKGALLIERTPSQTKINYDRDKKIAFAARLNFLYALVIAANVLYLGWSLTKPRGLSPVIVQAYDAAEIMQLVNVFQQGQLLTPQQLASREIPDRSPVPIATNFSFDYGLDEDLEREKASKAHNAMIDRMTSGGMTLRTE